MPKAARAYGASQPEILVLPLPIGLEHAPTSNMDNYEIGQVVFTPPRNPTAFYIYAGAGVWSLFASGSGDIVSVLGTANQITSSVAGGVATLSLPAAVTAPGSVATTSGLTVGTKLSVTTGVNASAGTTGALTAGAITVATTAITANSLVFFATHTLGTVTIPQSYRVSARTPGTSFAIQSSDATDTSTVDYWIIN